MFHSWNPVRWSWMLMVRCTPDMNQLGSPTTCNFWFPVMPSIPSFSSRCVCVYVSVPASCRTFAWEVSWPSHWSAEIATLPRPFGTDLRPHRWLPKEIQWWNCWGVCDFSCWILQSTWRTHREVLRLKGWQPGVAMSQGWMDNGWRSYRNMASWWDTRNFLTRFHPWKRNGFMRSLAFNSNIFLKE